MSVADAFAAVMAELDAPMLLVTCAPGGHPSGCLVGFATQCSIDPPAFLVCISRANHTFEEAGRAEFLAVHLVPRRADMLAERFGGETGDAIDKFAGTAWHPGPHGAPILDDCPNWFVGRVRDRVDLGDHAGFLLEPLAVAHRPGHVGLRQQRAAHEIDPGHPA